MCTGRRGRLLFERPGRDSKTHGGTVSTTLDLRSLSHVTILGDGIPWNQLNHWLNCHRIKLRSNSALIFTVTATSGGLFALLEGCLCVLGATIIELHSFLAQYIEPLIVFMFRIPVDNCLWQSWRHCKANNDVLCILWHRLPVLIPPLGVFVAVVVGKSVSHHHCHSGWQRSEQCRVYRDTWMMGTDWATKGVRWCRGRGDVRSDGEYIFGSPGGS